MIINYTRRLTRKNYYIKAVNVSISSLNIKSSWFLREHFHSGLIGVQS